ncbi:MAG: HPr family phosphocarrier protein [Gemmatimonadota bacterium]|nr:HPr family phosphocarrier protein [Gemmatimonadota bacterium]MDH5760163.1 HPr family phosphocarrier protein [Gemmatimonadota bacterium]
MSTDERLTREIQVVNRAGMHARPAAEFVRTASGFRSHLTVAKDGLEVNAKSIMGVLMLAAEQGSRLVVAAKGDDAAEAIDALALLVSRGFDEER